MSEQSEQMPQRSRLGRIGAIGAGITAAARCAGQLLVTFLPVAVLCLVTFVALMALAGDRVVTVNGVVQFPQPSAALVALTTSLAVLGAFVMTGVAAASSLVVAGRLTGTRVDGYAALRRALRAWRPCVAFTVMLLGYGTLVTLAVLVLAALWAGYPHSPVRLGVVAGFVVLLVLTLYLLRYVLVVPAAVLGDARHAFTDARQLAANRASHTLLALLVSSAVPALVFLGVDLLAATLPTVPHALLTAVAGVLAGWLYVTLFAATTTAICVGRSGVGSDESRAPSRRLPVAVALLFAVLPAVGYGLYPTTGPRSLPVVHDQVLRGLGEDRADFASTLVRGRGVVAYGSSLVWCGDAPCRNQHRVPIPGHLIRLSVASLPDGGVALAGWTPKDMGPHSYRSVSGEKVTDRWWQYDLVVLECRPQGCGDVAHAPVPDRADRAYRGDHHDPRRSPRGGGQLPHGRPDRGGDVRHGRVSPRPRGDDADPH